MFKEIMNDVSSQEEKIKSMSEGDLMATIDELETYAKANELTDAQAQNLFGFAKLLPEAKEGSDPLKDGLFFIFWTKMSETRLENAKILHKHFAPLLMERIEALGLTAKSE